MGVDAVRAHMVLGALAGFTYDVEALRNHFNTATALAPRDDSVAANYAIGLQHLGLLPEALEPARIAAELVPENLGHLRRALEYSLFSGKIEEASMFAETLKLRTPSPSPLVNLPAAARRVMSKHGIEEAELAEALGHAFNVLRKHRVRHGEMIFEVEEVFDAEMVACIIHIEADDHEALALGNELALLLVEMPEWHPAWMVIDYVGRVNS